MRGHASATFLVLLCAVAVMGISVNSEALSRLGKTIPVHIPTQTVISNDTFEVPYWLGAYYATVDVPSNWTLPLTIGNGGQAYPGEFLIIRNYGPASITLYPQAPETIDGAPSYLIQAETTAEIISGYPDWLVVVASSSQIQNIYMFEGTDAADSSSTFTVEIGLNSFNAPPSSICNSAVSGNCSGWNTVSMGNGAGQGNVGSYVNNVGFLAGQYNAGINVNNIGSYTGQYNTVSGSFAAQPHHVNNIGNAAGRYNTGASVNNIGQTTGANNTGANTNNIGRFAGQYNTGADANNIGHTAGRYNAGASCNNIGTGAGFNNTGVAVNNIGWLAGQPNSGSYTNNVGFHAGQSNTGSYCSHNGANAGISNTFNHCYTNGLNSVCTAANQFIFGASANPLHLRLPSDTGSYCTGAAYDTCLNRGRAGAFTLDAGQDFYSTGFVCAGTGCTSAAPSAASSGLYDSATRVVRSCTAGAGITCSVTDGVLTVTATSGLQKNALRYVPTSSDSPCEVGDTVFSAPYMYACVAANTWHRFEGSRF